MTLYHYCSTQAFFSIVSSRSIWLSDLAASNDSEEGLWFSRLFMDLASKSKQEHSIWPFLAVEMGAISKDIPTLGFCLSQREDMLSQWRGYADDGSGFSIGFHDEFFARWTEQDIRIERLRYTPEEHVELIRETIAAQNWGVPKDQLQTIDQVEAAMSRRPEQMENDASWVAIMLYHLAYLIKNPAFAEEEETRLIGRTDFSRPSTEFRARGSSLVAYRALHFSGNPCPSIKKVYIGPKNQTPVDVVASFLRKYGFGEVEVISSSATL